MEDISRCKTPDLPPLSSLFPTILTRPLAFDNPAVLPENNIYLLLAREKEERAEKGVTQTVLADITALCHPRENTISRRSFRPKSRPCLRLA